MKKAPKVEFCSREKATIDSFCSMKFSFFNLIETLRNETADRSIRFTMNLPKSINFLVEHSTSFNFLFDHKKKQKKKVFSFFGIQRGTKIEEEIFYL